MSNSSGKGDSWFMYRWPDSSSFLLNSTCLPLFLLTQSMPTCNVTFCDGQNFFFASLSLKEIVARNSHYGWINPRMNVCKVGIRNIINFLVDSIKPSHGMCCIKNTNVVFQRNRKNYRLQSRFDLLRKGDDYLRQKKMNKKLFTSNHGLKRTWNLYIICFTQSW